LKRRAESHQPLSPFLPTKKLKLTGRLPHLFPTEQWRHNDRSMISLTGETPSVSISNLEFIFCHAIPRLRYFRRLDYWSDGFGEYWGWWQTGLVEYWIDGLLECWSAEKKPLIQHSITPMFSKEMLLQRLRHRLAAGMHVQLGVDVFHVSRDGERTEK